MGSSDVLGF